jgi:hypothetical protein
MSEQTAPKGFKKVAEGYLRMKSQIAKVKEKAAEAMEQGVQTLEVGGAAFGFGYLRGRMSSESKPFAIAGVPTDLGAGLALHTLAFMGGFDKYAEHGHNLGDGALASYLTFKGIQFGKEAAAKAGTASGYDDPAMLTAGGIGASAIRDASLAAQIANLAG